MKKKGTKKIKKKKISVGKGNNSNFDQSDSRQYKNWVDRIGFVPIHENHYNDSRIIHQQQKQQQSVSSGSQNDDDENDDSNDNQHHIRIHNQVNADGMKIENQQTTNHKQDTPSIDTTTKAASTTSTTSISIITWNVLAEAYCSRRSHRNLPYQYQNAIFTNKKKRRLNVCHIIQNKLIPIADVICLQEVDIDDIYKTFKLYGYNGIETMRSVKGNNGGRVDACAIYVNERDSPWRLQQHQVIQLDDLASLTSNTNNNSTPSSSSSSSATIEKTDGNKNKTSSSSSINDEKNSNSSSSSSLSCNNNNNTHNKEKFNSTNMQGIQQAFLRRNIALIVRLYNIHTNETIVIANAHIFWNPYYEYVKLCQAHYILQLAKNNFMLGPDEPFVFCGDFNSRPGGITHTYLSHGMINAKQVAPWYSCQNEDNDDVNENFIVDDDDKAILKNISDAVSDDSSIESCDNDSDETSSNCNEPSTDDDELEDLCTKTMNDDMPEVVDRFASFKIMAKNDNNLSLTENLIGKDEATKIETTKNDATTNDEMSQNDIPKMKYLLDVTLNKFCRWLRILGQDATLETDEQEKLRTSEGKMILFDLCKLEGRTLITTSNRLLHRRDCPSSVYFISPQTLPKLEVALVHMLLTHGVILEPHTFLSRCVMCNGKIIQVHPIIDKQNILADYQAPADLLNDNMDVYECNNCKQGYWWCDRPTSSASRVKNTACELYEFCLRAGVPTRYGRRRNSNSDLINDGHGEKDDDDEYDNLFRHLDATELRKQGWDYNIPGSHLLRQCLDVIKWLKDEKLQCPFSLESVHALKSTDTNEVIGETLPFTNVTYDFINTLDYVFFDTKSLYPTETLYVPKSFKEMNRYNIQNGHLLPSDIWPSDHLAVGARLFFRSTKK